MSPLNALKSAVGRCLPRRAYLSESHFERERDLLFSREWFCIGREEILPNIGDYLIADVVGESVLVVRTQTGALHAHYNICRHHGNCLSLAEPQPTLNAAITPTGTFRDSITCPFHAWSYELDGTLRCAPTVGNAAPIDRHSLTLYPVKVATWGGFMFLNLSPDAEYEAGPIGADALDLASVQLQRRSIDTLRIAHRVIYDVAANWKMIVERFSMRYRCADLRVESRCALPISVQHAESFVQRTYRAAIEDREPSLSAVRRHTAYANRVAQQNVPHECGIVYPNLILGVCADYVAAFMVQPISPGRTIVICDLLFPPEAVEPTNADSCDALAFWDTSNRQDWAVCESAQQGMQSRMFQFNYYAPMEDASLDLRRYLEERLGAL
jgi:Rieske 2Fe-2S family protein